jgi:hypothetical protein
MYKYRIQPSVVDQHRCAADPDPDSDPDPDPAFHFEADQYRDPDPDPTSNYQKLENHKFLLLFTATPVYIVCIFLISVKGVIIFRIFDRILKFSGKSLVFLYTSLKWIQIWIRIRHWFWIGRHCRSPSPIRIRDMMTIRPDPYPDPDPQHCIQHHHFCRISPHPSYI